MNGKQILTILLISAILTTAVVMILIKMDFNKEDNKMSSIINKERGALETIYSRKSVREYTDQKVTRTQLDTLVRAAMCAPTAVNKQPWAFIIVDDRAKLDSLAAELPYGKMLAHASAAIVVCGDTEKALLEVDETYWVQDCSAAAQNILLAAESMGLGAVWTGVFPRTERIQTVRTILQLPNHIIPLNVIPIGYPANPNEQPKDKYKPENIHFNGW